MIIQRSAISRSALLLLVGVAFVAGVNAQSAPEAPSGLAASVSGTTVTLQWQPAAGGGAVRNYLVEVGSSPGASNLTRVDTGSAAPTLVATNVAAGTYYVRIRGVNSAGVSGTSNETVVRVGSVCSSAATAPGPLVSSVSGSSVQLSWAASSGPVSTYVFEIGSFSGSTNLGTIELGSAATTFATSGVAPGTYFVRVKARNPCGLSGPSNDTVVIVGGTTSGGPQLQIINRHSWVIEYGPSAGRLAVSGEVINNGGSPASDIYLSEERFSPGGSRLGGSMSHIVGRSRRLTHSGEVNHATLGPGETGCFARVLGTTDANQIGRYNLRLTFETFPTAELQGRLQAAAIWPPYTRERERDLVAYLKLTNVGSTPTVWNRVVVLVKDAAGRVASCGSQAVVGATNRAVPGYGVTNVLLPGETGYEMNSQPYLAGYLAPLGAVTFWPQWKE